VRRFALFIWIVLAVGIGWVSAIISGRTKSSMDLISRAVLIGVVVLAGALLFTPYEAFLEAVIALAIVTAALVGFLMHPRRDVFYVRTSVRLVDPDRNEALERDFLAVKVELIRLWLLFLPTFLAVSSLVFFAVGGPAKFSYLNWILSSGYGWIALIIGQFFPLLVLVFLSVWIGERRVLRDAEACSVRSFSISGERIGRVRRVAWVSYLFMGEHGEYYGGSCLYFGLVQPQELATIVFHNVRKPELNKIAMGFLFHRLIVLGRGVTDVNKQTAAAQMTLAETTPSS
jgi:hypothetical protein